MKKPLPIDVIVIPVVVKVEPSTLTRKHAGHHAGQIATESYRQGWDNIFGKKQPVGQA
jgi:hypothetical protein